MANKAKPSRSAGQVILWWEKRRPVYNLIVAAICLGIVLYHRQNPGPRLIVDWIGERKLSLILIIMSNIWYTGGWIVELSLRFTHHFFWNLTRRPGQDFPWFGPVMFVLGIAFSLVFCVWVMLGVMPEPP
jgi:hypothetical protein